MHHIGVYSLGYRIEAGGVVLAYTGDTGPCDDRDRARRATRTCSCARPRTRTHSKLYPFHLSAAQAGERRDRGRRDRLVLTHISRRSSTTAVSIARGRRDVRRARRHRGRRGWSWRSADDAAPTAARPDELRPVAYELGYQEWAAGSVLFSMGKTRVLCAASVSTEAPRWLRGTGKGWVTGEYSMLPASTNERSSREVNRGRPGGGPRRSSG